MLWFIVFIIYVGIPLWALWLHYIDTRDIVKKELSLKQQTKQYQELYKSWKGK